MEGALIAGSIAEESDADIGSLSELDAEGGAHRNRQTATDDTVGA
jgi:hypothetical protein